MWILMLQVGRKWCLSRPFLPALFITNPSFSPTVCQDRFAGPCHSCWWVYVYMVVYLYACMTCVHESWTSVVCRFYFLFPPKNEFSIRFYDENIEKNSQKFSSNTANSYISCQSIVRVLNCYCAPLTQVLGRAQSVCEKNRLNGSAE